MESILCKHQNYISSPNTNQLPSILHELWHLMFPQIIHRHEILRTTSNNIRKKYPKFPTVAKKIQAFLRFNIGMFKYRKYIENKINLSVTRIESLFHFFVVF